MFEDILSKEKTTFKELEENVFGIACEIANEIMKNLLEEYDKQISESRDKARYRHKGYETTTLKTKTGLVEYRRTKYLETLEDGSKKCTYLTDETLEIKNIGQISSGLIDLVVKNIKEVSFRTCSETINNCTGINISSVGVWNIIQKLGQEIKKNEKEKVLAHSEDRLQAGTKETPVVYCEADEICIYTQGKLRSEQIKKYKKEHPDEEVPKRVRNIALKMGMTYEGWKQIGINRFALVGKEYVAGYITGEEMGEIISANLHSKYDMSKVELKVLNSDGASWIKQLLMAGMIHQADNFHIREKISVMVREPEDVDILKEMFFKREYKEMIEYVEFLKYKYDGECEEIEKLNKLKKYLEKRQDSIARYNDDPEVKKKLARFSKRTGLKYKNMGCQESNNYSVLTRRFKHRRMSWSKNGSENLAKVITTYASESCTDIMSNLELQTLPEQFIEYAEKHIREIEENIKKKKLNSKHIGYEMKQGTLTAYPNMLKMLKDKPMSELAYR
jgi:hypothetical protein